MFIKNKNKVFFKNKVSLNRGFTLIELLVVIAIIGILGSIVYAPFQTARRKGRDAQRIVEIKNLASSIALYADSNNGQYPADLVQLQTTMSDTLPPNANCGTSACSSYLGSTYSAPSSAPTYDYSKYNYTAYKDQTTSKIIGYHLYTHLETASPVLAGAAKCTGSATSQSSTACIIGPNTIADSATSVQEPSTPKFILSDRTSDTDANCSTDTTSCILDYHQ